MIFTVPRQSGKTTLVLAWELHRALRWGTPQQIVYTAQTAQDARKKLFKDQIPAIERSPLRSALDRIVKARGEEGLIFKNGSLLDITASTETAMHGRTLDLVVIDEAFADKTNAREQAALPAMATRRDAQMLILSTAGTVESTFLKRKVERGREAVEAGETDGIAYFEWSADPDADIHDPETWQFHPGLGLIVDESTLRHAYGSHEPDDFARAWLNRWTVHSETLIAPAAWQKCLDKKAAPDGPLVFSVDVALDRSRATIAVSDRASRIEIVESRDGMAWVAEKIRSLARRHKAPFVVDGYGPAGTLVDPLEALGIQITRYTTRDVVAACGLFYDAIHANTLKVRPDEYLEAAVAGVKKRTVSGSGWLWGRNSTDIDITPLYAATLAWHNATQKKPEPTSRSFVL